MSRTRMNSIAMANKRGSPSFSKEEYEAFLLRTQERICNEMALVDGSGKHFCIDKWSRGQDSSNGYGITRVIEDGNLLEKGAVNVSIVHGQLSEARAKAMSVRRQGLETGCHYFAGALSLVFHPQNPYVPTFRADVRYFEIEGGSGWFGGGADLTPYYLDIEDAKYFHRFLKQICDRYNASFYSQCKSQCDAYFYIPARKQHRGIGGIFFDDLEYFDEQSDTGNKLLDTNGKVIDIPEKSEISGRDKAFEFVKELADGFTSSFLPIANKSRFLEYGERQKVWQLLQRGRYLEFNLLYDRGIKFGLDGGRMESIMVSAPPLVAWKYNAAPEIGSPEDELLKVLCKPCEWV